jgi:two-component system cell cycle response regulator
VGKKILIVDDSKTFQQLERALLAGRGYQFLEANDGSQAVKLAVEHIPDLILLDVQMPVMDGGQVLHFLRNEPKTKHIPIIMITTLGEQKDNKRILSSGGATAVLHKPINGIELNRLVRDILRD